MAETDATVPVEISWKKAFGVEAFNASREKGKSWSDSALVGAYQFFCPESYDMREKMRNGKKVDSILFRKTRGKEILVSLGIMAASLTDGILPGILLRGLMNKYL